MESTTATECIHDLDPRWCAICRAKAGYLPGTDRQRADCSIRAIVDLTGASYAEAEALLAAAGRRPGQGVSPEVLVAALAAAGWTATPTPITIEQARSRPGRNYLVAAWQRRIGHAFTVVDGEVRNAGRYLVGGCRYEMYEVA
jgi:hypothetical protein